MSDRITDENDSVLNNHDLTITTELLKLVIKMSIFGSDYGYGDNLYVISGDLDMDGKRITDLKNPANSNNAVNKRYMNKRIEYKTKAEGEVEYL